MFWENSGGGLTTQPLGTATMTTVTSASRVDLENFSSRCWTFRCTHTSADRIRVLCTRLALPLTLYLTSRLAPRARLAVDRDPGLVKDFSCVCIFWDETGRGLAPVGPRVDTATIRTVLGTYHVDSGSFSSGCCAFRRTHTSADPIWLLCIRLALPPVLSTWPLHTNSGCEKERGILIGPWRSAKAAPVRNYLEFTGPVPVDSRQ